MSHHEPVEHSMFESLHRAQWIAKNRGEQEFGRLLNTWMDRKGDGILREWYLQKIDHAEKVSAADGNWELIGPLLQSQGKANDEDLFRCVAGIDEHPVGLDEVGRWRVPLPAALSILKTSLECSERKCKDRWQLACLFAGLFMLALFSRFM